MSAPLLLLQYVRTKSGLISLANGVPQVFLAALSNAAERYLFAVAFGNTTCPISIAYSGGELARVYNPYTTFVPLYGRRILPPNTQITIVANGADSTAVSYTLVYADTPANVVTAAPITIGPG